MATSRLPQTWRTFLKNHIGQLVSVDFFTVHTVTFRVLFCFLVLRHDRRRVVHFNVTVHPTAAWTAQQIVQAFPYEEAPRFLNRDRDGIYGEDVQRRIRSMGIEEVLIAPRSPWQNPYCERLVGSIRRECLDHVIVFSEDHLRSLPVVVLRLLPREPHALVAGSERPAATSSRATVLWRRCCHPPRRRSASPLCASILIPDAQGRTHWFSTVTLCA